MTLTRRRLLLAATPGLAPSFAQAAQTLRMSTGERNADCWVASQLLAAIYQEAGLQLMVEPVPLARARLMALNGQVDGEVMRIHAYGDENPQLTRVEPSFFHIGVVACSLAGSKVSVQTLADLAQYRVGATRGIAYVQRLTRDLPSVTLGQSPEQVLRMLAAGRVDVVLQTTNAAMQAVGMVGIKDPVVSPELATYEVYNYLCSEFKSLAPRIGGATRRLMAHGELARLTTKYQAAVRPEDVEQFVSKANASKQTASAPVGDEH